MDTIALDSGQINKPTQDIPPRWLLLWTGLGEQMRAQRRTWGDDASSIVDSLVRTGQWIVYRDGDAVECKHRCQING